MTSAARCSAPTACCWRGAHPSVRGSANTELFADAYVAQFAHFVDCVHAGVEPSVTGVDARVALEIALAARESVETAAPVALNGGAAMTGFQLAVCSEMVYTDLPILDRVKRIDELGFAVEIWSWHDKDLDALAATGARSHR